MKSFILGLLLLIVCMPLLGQSETMVSAKIAFPFYIGNVEYPAGEYIFSTTDHPGTMIRISGSPQRFKLITNISQNTPVKKSKLVFIQDGPRIYLHQVWIAGDNHVHDINHKDTIKELAAGK